MPASCRLLAGGLLAIVIALGSMLVFGAPAGACSMPPHAVTFVGEAVGGDRTAVEFRVNSIVEVAPTDVGSPAPEPGQTVRVSYGDDREWIDIGQVYRVSAFAGGSEIHPEVPTLGSGVHTPGETCGANGTTWADGSPINTAVWARYGPTTWPGRAVITGLVVAAVVLFVLMRPRRAAEA